MAELSECAHKRLEGLLVQAEQGAVVLQPSIGQIIESSIAGTLVFLLLFGLSLLFKPVITVVILAAGLITLVVAAFTFKRPRLELSSVGFRCQTSDPWTHWELIADFYFKGTPQQGTQIIVEFKDQRTSPFPSLRMIGDSRECGLTQDELLQLLQLFQRKFGVADGEVEITPPLPAKASVPIELWEATKPVTPLPISGSLVLSKVRDQESRNLRKVYHSQCGTWSSLEYRIPPQYQNPGGLITAFLLPLEASTHARLLLNCPHCVNIRRPEFACGKCGYVVADHLQLENGEQLKEAIERFRASITVAGRLFTYSPLFLFVALALTAWLAGGIIPPAFIAIVLIPVIFWWQQAPFYFAVLRHAGFFWSDPERTKNTSAAE